MFGASLTAHLSSLSEGLPRAKEEFSAALVDLANTQPQDVSENPVYEVYSKGTALVPIELDHMSRVLTTMSDREAHASHLASQTLANMVVACRAAYLDHSGLRPQIQHALMALHIYSSKLLARKVQEARLWDAEEDKDQSKAFLKPSSSGYHNQQTSTKGKGSAVGLQLLLKLTSQSPSHLRRLRRILAPSSMVVAPLARAGDKRVGPNPSFPYGSPPMVGCAPSSPVYKPVGGWLADFVSPWLHAAGDAYVLRTVSEGIWLEFLERPPLVESLILFTWNAKRESELCLHMEEMVSKEALELAPLPSPGFYSNIFLVPKC